MQLKKFTDYSLRLLIQLALHPDEWVSINSVASSFSISRNHLLKVVTELSRQGLIQTQRGKFGGLKLNREAMEINIGTLIASLEGRVPLVECASPLCPILPDCRLKGVLEQAETAFFQTLSRYSLQDLIQGREAKLIQLITT